MDDANPNNYEIQRCGHQIYLDEVWAGRLLLSHHTIELGQEEHPTFYMYRKLERPYHIDYVFIPQHAAKTSSIAIGDPNDWLIQSDHMPLFADIT